MNSGSGSTVQIFQEGDAKIYGSPEQLTDPFAVTQDGEQRGYDWMPLVDGDKVSALCIP